MLAKSLVSDILKCPSWIKSQLGTILGITSMSFVTLWLEDRGTEPKDILLALSLLYLVTLLPLLFKRSGAITSSLLLISSVGMFVSLKLESIFGVSLCLFVATIQSARDLFYVDLMEDYAHIAKRNALNITKVVAATMLVGVIATSVSTPLIGLFSSEYRSLYFVALSLIGLTLAGGLIFRTQVDGSSVKESVSSYPLPVSLHWLCSLSMIVNIVTFFVRYFVLPITLLQIAKQHGFEDSVLVVAGSLIGVMSVVGFLFRRNADDRHCRRDMYQGVGAVLIACVLIAVTITALSFTTSCRIALI